ncbi:thioredoxin domain-containing protein [Streptomyces oceani]|uniref:Disulfide bond formation protein DsbA n=1 Tax=Streptomyces oceani TaxID=1075402 RepID=A0A1E7JZH4_9ACTN|nr:thioredoxin domain-containing protein [Streptomyces oceani]OEU97069.1 disulfide bond formation protein DsbA [Streptomyces oceani]
MSKRNSQEAKRAARERLRAEQEKQAKRDRTRRQLVVAGSIVAVLAIAAGIGVAVSSLSGDSEGDTDWAAAKKEKLVKPDNTSGKKGTEVVIGKDSAKKTLRVFEDLRCPACASFEQASGDMLLKDIEEGKYKAQFTMATFIDDMAQGTGSKNSLSALGAALNVSEDAFLEYKKALYSKEHHPEESEDKFAEDEYLIKVAKDVKELKGNKSFEKDVKKGTYDRWALEMAKSFKEAGVESTPTFKMDGKEVKDPKAPENPVIMPEQFRSAVDAALKK